MSLTDRLLERSVVTCSRCGVMMLYAKAIQDDGAFYCPLCDEQRWDEEEDEQEDRFTCGCPYCFCMNDVAYPGENCADCNSHAHQG